MSGSKLTSLLQYRFVKKDSNSPPDSNSGSQSSGSATLSPSQTSTQPPVTPNKTSLPRTQTTPDGKRPVTFTPDSPIFGVKSSLPGRNLISSPSQPSSSSSSPWLSKHNGNLQNGAPFKKPGRQLPTFDDEVDDSELYAIPDYESKLESLRQMFPARSESDIQQGLIDGYGDVEDAIDVIIGLKEKNSFKRIRTDSHDNSMSDPDTPVRPRKRIRQISSESETDPDSQTTVSYGLESQRSDATEIYDLTKDDEEEEDFDEPISAENENKVRFLMDCFKEKERKEIVRALSKNNWVVADATVFMSTTTLKSVTSDNKVRTKARNLLKAVKDNIDVDEGDEEEDYGEESDASADSIEEESSDAKSTILSFFDDASLEELMATPGCSRKKAELIISIRPFKSWVTMTEKFISVKGLSYDLISGCREVIKIRNIIIRLMQQCERISSTMEEVVFNLLHANTQLEDDNYIVKQPSNLNPDLQLKPFQMVGLNWLRIMHSQELNGILADEMGLGKTIQTIAFLAHLLEEGELGPHAIIVPSSTIDNWIREAKRWCPSLKVLIYYGSQEDRRTTRHYILQNSEDFHVIITTYNMVTGSVEDRALFKKFEFHYAIFDEGHLLKNMSSLRYQNLMRISADRRLLLTGTPLQNNLLELMSLLCFVMPDMFIGKTEQLKRMFGMITRSNPDEKRSSYEQDRIAHAKRIMKPFVLRRLKSEVMSQLPKKVEQLDYCTMIPSQQELYDKLISKFSSQISEETYTSGGAGMLMQLRKAANHPLLHRHHYDNNKLNKMAKALAEEPSHKERGALAKFIVEDLQVMSDFEIHNTCKNYRSCLAGHLLDESLIEESGKFRLLDDKLVTFKEEGHRVLLFSQFTSMMDIMEIYMKRRKYKYIRLDGSTPVIDRVRSMILHLVNTECSISLVAAALVKYYTRGSLDEISADLTLKFSNNIFDLSADDFKHALSKCEKPFRQKLIDDYNTDTSIFVFLLSTKAGGLGINLTSANVVILHDIDFNPYNDKQAEDRCHRVGQTREVLIYRLISKDTVEEAMLKCAQDKLKLEKDVISTDTKDDDGGPTKDVASILKQALTGHDTKRKT